MGRAAQQILSQAPGLSPATRCSSTSLLGYDLLYLLRGAPVVLYGDEVGMIGSGGDKAAREDMFPTQVGEWQTETRVGSPPIGNGSSFDVTDNPIERAAARRSPACATGIRRSSTGASVVRYANGPVLVVSRIDRRDRPELVTAFNNGDARREGDGDRRARPGATWSVAVRRRRGDRVPAAKLTLTIPAASAVLVEAGDGDPGRRRTARRC